MDLNLLAPFDADAHAAARPIYFADENNTQGVDAPASLQRLASLNGFAGEPGVVLANEDGVLLGVGDGEDPMIVAAVSERMPAGDYRLTGEAADAARAGPAMLGWLLGTYQFDRYKDGRSVGARLIAPSGADVEAVRRAGAAFSLARDLVNTPAADMGPDALEAAARRVAAPFGATVSSIIGDELAAQNFPLIHAVGRAAAVAPRLIDIHWGAADSPKLTIVGKGVCFDSGGLNLKGAAGMALMKKDMGGAANTLALAQMIMAANLPVRLRVLIPAVENAVSGGAFRPGDVLRARSGLTVEIGNTDAEGRLILADAMTYGGEDAPEAMLTLATLTGAARIALGPELPPFYCDDDAFASALLDAAAATGDPVWRMPLWRGYEPMLASPIADLNNAPNGGFAGSITAALFLKRFAPARAVWTHFDMYAWRAKAAPGRPVGGEAQAILALFETFRRQYAG